MKRTLLFFLCILYIHKLMSQISSGGEPPSFTQFANPSIENIWISTPSIDDLHKEDLRNNEQSRIGVSLQANKSMDNSGTWTRLNDGSYIWRLQINAPGALAIGPYFNKFYLPKGSKLFMYDKDNNQLKGAFTFANNSKSGAFSIESVYGDAFILEYYEPQGIHEQAIVELTEVGFFYQGIPDYHQKGFGDSDACEVNINCSPEGDDWQDEKRGVVKLRMKIGGSIYKCTGSLMNNTSQDQTPYILTADHCADHGGYPSANDLNQWIFYFNYESWGCSNPQYEPPYQTMTGASKIAYGGDSGQSGSDFYLVKLNENVPAWYQPYFNGWLAKDSTSLEGVTIHHPDGDIKKISHYTQELTTTGWPGSGSGLPSHWKVFWSETSHNWGVTEVGSSGSALFNSDGKIIGTLSGGEASCSNQSAPDYYGKLSYHWESNGLADTSQLKPWLDPLNLGIESLNGLKITSGLEKNYATSLVMGPNPVKNRLFIECSKDNQLVEIRIMDIIGRTIMIQDINNKQNIDLDVSKLKQGEYILEVHFQNGARSCEKIIKV